MRRCYILLLTLGGMLNLSACHGKKDLSNLQDRIFFPGLGNDITYDNPQVAPGLKQVIQYEGKRPLNIVAYNRQGQVIFHHYKQYVGSFWPGGYITMITGYVYEGERIIRTYELHSNVGFKIKDYTYPWLGWQVQEYVRENTYDPSTRIVNENPFRYIEQVMSWEQLVQHPKIQELETRGEKRLVATRTFGLDSLLDRKVYQDGNEPAWQVLLTYNAQQQPIQQRATLDGKPDQLITLTYDKVGRLSQALELGATGDTAQWQVYQYNKQGQMRNQFDLIGPYTSATGEVQYEFSKLAFQYSPQGKVSKRTTSAILVTKACGFNCEGQLREEIEYRHNAQGYIIEEQAYDATAEKRTTKKYHYSYSYY